jgi:hypothetical protein
MNLPKEIWKEISMIDCKTYLLLVQTSKMFKLPDVIIKKHFTKIIHHETTSQRNITIYTLPNGWVHRDDGPAKIFSWGTQMWYKNNELHRDDGPACIDRDGEYWYQHDLLHRNDGGPSVIVNYGNSNTRYHWLSNGVHHRDNDMPAAVTQFGTTFYLTWIKNGVQYRGGIYEGMQNKTLWLLTTT